MMRIVTRERDQRTFRIDLRGIDKKSRHNSLLGSQNGIIVFIIHEQSGNVKGFLLKTIEERTNL